MRAPLLVDAHQDLAWNILTFGRDYTLSAAETRLREQGTLTPQYNGDTLLGWPDYQHGRVAVVFSTLFATPARHKLGEWDSQCYATAKEAHLRYRLQMETYERLVGDHPTHFRLIERRADLKSILTEWQQTEPVEQEQGHPVGLVILMEGAEGVRDPAELEEWYERGVRIIGLAWAGTRFSGGTHEPGPLTSEGYALLERMAEFNLTLDLSHMDEKAALQALDFYPGPVIASHANALSMVKGSESNRHLTDRLIQGLLGRGGTIGIVPSNSFLRPGWKESGERASVTLDYVIAQIDYICQMAGDALHVGLGSDFDGGFGLQSVPAEVDTIADLRKIIPLLAQKGYTEADMTAILGGNWLDYLQSALPEVL
jgi:membrane dipeptidase